MITSFKQWRERAGALLAQHVEPHAANWEDESGTQALFSPAPCGPGEKTRGQVDAVTVSRALLDALKDAARHRSEDRWSFLYKVLWRWQQGEKDVLSAADPDGGRLHAMIKAVRRERHDMHAYLRFRKRPEAAGPPRFVAWYEPAHEVLDDVAAHFAARMGQTSWMIATPQGCALWDGATLEFAPPAMDGPIDVADDGEALWLAYYRSIFNPSRLNPEVMHGHIPARVWRHLPEGALVPTMVADAASGARRVGQAAAVTRRGGTVIPVSHERAQPQRELPAAMDDCRRCELWQQGTQAVPGVGPPHASILLLGEQPGDQEDLAGLPFVGPAGQLLDRALAAAELARDTLYLTNSVKHFKWEPRGKRRLHKTPAQREVEACRPWLEQELARVQPKVIVALGSTALKSALGVKEVSLGAVLGQALPHQGRWIIPAYHPAYILRQPQAAAREDALQALIAALREAQRLSVAP